jgi:hypothetical protein
MLDYNTIKESSQKILNKEILPMLIKMSILNGRFLMASKQSKFWWWWNKKGGGVCP